MSVLSRQFPPPADWQAFERVCADLFRRVWLDPATQLNGRSGQPQAGVDVYGEDKQSSLFAGVQCKGRDGEFGGTVTERELRDEVEKAKLFRPPLQIFILATTAPNDVRIQEIARAITEDHRKAGLFDVHVYGWGELKQRITDHPDVVRKHFSDLAPADVLQAIDDGRERVVSELSALIDAKLNLLSARLPTSSTVVSGDGTDDALHARIRDASLLTQAGQARAALVTLRRLRDTEWHGATPRNRFRILSAIASANLILGDQAAAVAGFREASRESPDYPPARAVLATAHFFDGDRALAFEQACGVLRDDPTCEQAALIALQAAADALSPDALQELIPEPLRTAPVVTVVLATMLRSRGHLELALGHARVGHVRAPEDWRGAALLAELLLSPILDDPALPLTKAVPAGAKADFDHALSLLKQAWAAVQETDYARHAVHIALNLSTALDVAGDEAKATIVVEEGLAIDPAFSPLLRRQAVRRALAADWSGVLATLNRMSCDDRDHEDRLLAGQAELALGRVAEARRIAQEVLGNAKEDRSAALAAALALEADLADDAPDTIVDAWLDRFPEAMLLRVAITRSKLERERLRERLVADVTRLTQGACDVRDRVMGADVLMSLGEHGQAADLLEGIVDIRLATIPLQNWLRALLLADRRTKARKLFERLPRTLREQEPYLGLGIAIYERAGLLPKARALLESRLLEAPDDLHVRLGWLAICERLGDISAVRTWLQTVPEAVDGSTRDLMALAHLIDRHLADPKALTIGYRAVRAGFNDPRLQLAYSVGLILQGRAIRVIEEHPSAIGPNTAVALEQVGGERRLARVIETADSPRIERDEVAPDDALAIRLLGRGVGDVVMIDSVGLGPIPFSVARISSKYLHLHFRVLADFESLFPEFPGFGSVPFNPAMGAEGLEPMLRLARERGTFVRDLEDQYRRGAVPLAFVAAASGATIFDVWEAFSSGANSRVYAANGSAEEFSRAADLLRTADLIILDPVAVYAAAQLDLEPAMRAAGKRLGVVQATRDLLRDLVGARDLDAEGKRGTFAWDGERYFMREFAPEELEAAVVHAKSALAFAERCELVASEGSGIAHNEAREVWRFLPEAFLDSVLAAQAADAPLLSDDVPLRALAEASAGVRTVWLQPLLQAALLGGRLQPADYAEAVGRLIDRNYEFTMFGSLELRQSLERTGWQSTGRVSRLVELLAKPTNDAQTVVAVLAQFTQQAWRGQRDSEKFRSVFSAIFWAFRRHDVAWAERIVEQVFERVGHYYRLRALTTRRHLWLRSTSLVPAERVVAEIIAPADRVLRRLADVFAACLGTEPSAEFLQTRAVALLGSSSVQQTRGVDESAPPEVESSEVAVVDV